MRRRGSRSTRSGAGVISTAILAVHIILIPKLIIIGGSIGERPELIEATDEAEIGRCTREPIRSTLGTRIATLIGASAARLFDQVHSRAVRNSGKDDGQMACPSRRTRHCRGMREDTPRRKHERGDSVT